MRALREVKEVGSAGGGGCISGFEWENNVCDRMGRGLIGGKGCGAFKIVRRLR